MQYDRPVAGLISTRTDVDVFTFIATGPTTITVTGAAYSNLDVQFTLKDSDGTVGRRVNPPVTKVSASQADGLDAT